MSESRHKRESSPFDAVVIVGSLGALHAWRHMSTRLVLGLPSAVILDLHRRGEGILEKLLTKWTTMAVRPALPGASPEPGTLHVAPAEEQLLIGADGRFEVTARENGGPGHPSADALLGSAAAAFGPRTIAVVLSGRLAGGARGARDVKRAGGRVLVQDPATAEAPSMPTAALATGCVDHALPLDSLADALVAFCAVPGAADLFSVRRNPGATGRPEVRL